MGRLSRIKAKKKREELYKSQKGICNWHCHRKITLAQAVLDHLDNDPNNNEDSNFQVICRSCNYKKNPNAILTALKYKGEAFDCVRVCVSDEKPARATTAEMERNLTSYPLFVDLLFKRMRSEYKIKLNPMFYDTMAKDCGCSQVTIKRYLGSETSNSVKAQFIVNSYGDPKEKEDWIEWKPEFDPTNVYRNEIKKFSN